MKDMKLVSGFAVFGFVLSFVSSLFSPHSSFIHKLLMALLFALVFGGLGFFIGLIFNKFLKDSDGDLGADLSSAVPTPSAAVSSGRGQLVDIVIQDEEISPGESDNRFAVGDNHHMLNDTDVSNTSKSEEPVRVVEEMPAHSPLQPVSEEKTVVKETPVSVQNSGFVPMSAAALTKAQPASEPVKSGGSTLDDSEGIDTLPDMNGFSFGSNESSSSNEDDVYDDDSDFEPAGSSGTAEVPEVKDAGLIAKAISSVLANEKSI